MEKVKKPVEKTKKGGGANPFDDFFGGPNTLTVMHGPHIKNIPIVPGMTIEDVREQFGDELGIGSEAIAIVGQDEIDKNDESNFVLSNEMVLLFTKDAGEKG